MWRGWTGEGLGFQWRQGVRGRGGWIIGDHGKRTGRRLGRGRGRSVPRRSLFPPRFVSMRCEMKSLFVQVDCRPLPPFPLSYGSHRPSLAPNMSFSTHARKSAAAGRFLGRRQTHSKAPSSLAQHAIPRLILLRFQRGAYSPCAARPTKPPLCRNSIEAAAGRAGPAQYAVLKRFIDKRPAPSHTVPCWSVWASRLSPHPAGINDTAAAAALGNRNSRCRRIGTMPAMLNRPAWGAIAGGRLARAP